MSSSLESTLTSTHILVPSVIQKSDLHREMRLENAICINLNRKHEILVPLHKTLKARGMFSTGYFHPMAVNFAHGNSRKRSLESGFQKNVTAFD